MTKKLLTIAMVCMISLLAGCGHNDDISAVKEISQVTEKATQSAPTEEPATELKTEAPTKAEETQAPRYDIEWTEFKYNISDGDGYTFEITCKLSPWILASNSDIIDSAWDEVGNGNVLPAFDDWELSLYNGAGFNNVYTRNSQLNGNAGYFIHTMTDMYYCVGQAKIKNTTTGWDVAENNPRNISANLSWTADINDINGGGSNMISRFYYQNDTIDNYGVVIKTSMKSNEAVSSFILMTPENFSPNYPNGEYYEAIKDSKFYPDNYDNGAHLGIIGKDKIYTD